MQLISFHRAMKFNGGVSAFYFHRLPLDEIHVQASDELVAFKMKWTLGIRQQRDDVIIVRHELMFQTSAQR